MEQIKKYWKEGLIALLIICFMNKCTQSCNRADQYAQLKAQADSAYVIKDSIIKNLQDSCTLLNTTIKIYEERVSGMQKSLDIQDEAARRITEAKKNINVKVNK